MKRLFILGAGASIDHSNNVMPSIGNFFQKAREAKELNFWDYQSSLDQAPLELSKFFTTRILITKFYGIEPHPLRQLMDKNSLQSHIRSLKENNGNEIAEDTTDSINLINVEELLTLTTLQHQVDPKEPSEENVIELIIQTINHYSEKVNKGKGTYKIFTEKILGKEDSIISFN